MKVLLVTLDNLGDTVLALPACYALQAAGAQVALWTKAYTAGLAPLVPGSPRFFSCDPVWDRSPGRGKGPLLPFLKTLSAMRAERFDAALVLRGNWRKNLSCAACGIPRRWSAAGRWANMPLPQQRPGQHVLEHYREAVKTFTGSDPGELLCSLPRPAAPAAAAPYAAVHPFSGDAARNLSTGAWHAVIAGLRARGLAVLVVCTPAEKARLALPPAEGVSYSCDGRPGIPEMASGIAGASVFIGHDSGPLHLAAALAVPAVGVIQERKIAVIAPRGRGPIKLAVFRESPSELGAEAVLALAGGLIC